MEKGKGGRPGWGGVVTGRNKLRKGCFSEILHLFLLRDTLQVGEEIFSGKNIKGFHGKKSLIEFEFNSWSII